MENSIAQRLIFMFALRNLLVRRTKNKTKKKTVAECEVVEKLWNTKENIHDDRPSTMWRLPRRRQPSTTIWKSVRFVAICVRDQPTTMATSTTSGNRVAYFTLFHVLMCLCMDFRFRPWPWHFVFPYHSSFCYISIRSPSRRNALRIRFSSLHFIFRTNAIKWNGKRKNENATRTDFNLKSSFSILRGVKRASELSLCLYMCVCAREGIPIDGNWWNANVYFTLLYYFFPSPLFACLIQCFSSSFFPLSIHSNNDWFECRVHFAYNFASVSFRHKSHLIK